MEGDAGVVLKGWAEKRGRVRKSWRRRWFVLVRWPAGVAAMAALLRADGVHCPHWRKLHPLTRPVRAECCGIPHSRRPMLSVTRPPGNCATTRRPAGMKRVPWSSQARLQCHGVGVRAACRLAWSWAPWHRHLPTLLCAASVLPPGSARCTLAIMTPQRKMLIRVDREADVQRWRQALRRASGAPAAAPAVSAAPAPDPQAADARVGGTGDGEDSGSDAGDSCAAVVMGGDEAADSADIGGPEIVLKEGVLVKRGTWPHTWRKRHFRLVRRGKRHIVLEYRGEAGEEEARGFVHLAGAAILPVDAPGRSHTFAVTTTERELLLCVADGCCCGAARTDTALGLPAPGKPPRTRKWTHGPTRCSTQPSLPPEGSLALEKSLVLPLSPALQRMPREARGQGRLLRKAGRTRGRQRVLSMEAEARGRRRGRRGRRAMVHAQTRARVRARAGARAMAHA